jgi:hypothetical protein
MVKIETSTPQIGPKQILKTCKKIKNIIWMFFFSRTRLHVYFIKKEKHINNKRYPSEVPG